MRRDVLRFGKIGRASIKRRVQIIDLDKKSMGDVRVHMAGVIVWQFDLARERASERIYPRA